jgi:hypothetical protein
VSNTLWTANRWVSLFQGVERPCVLLKARATVDARGGGAVQVVCANQREREVLDSTLQLNPQLFPTLLEFLP